MMPSRRACPSIHSALVRKAAVFGALAVSVAMVSAQIAPVPTGVTELEARGVIVRELRERNAYVSLSVSASVSTIFEVGPLHLSLVDSHASGYAELVAFDATGKLQPLGLNVTLQLTGGSRLATLPQLTVRLDRENATLDLYADAQLVAGDVPFDPARDRQRIAVTAGEDGARVRAISQPDRNPLFEDANDNGIDDDFERSRKGRLLVAADKEERKALAQEWRDFQKRNPSAVKALHLDSLKPGGG